MYLRGKNKYDENRVRSFDPAWKNKHTWVECNNLDQIYCKHSTSVRNKFVSIKNKSTDYNLCEDGTDKNVLICVPCRSKHYADNHLSEKEYVPTKSDFENQPFIFGGISFHKNALDKHACCTNKFHALANIRKVNLDEIESGESSEAQNAFLTLNEN